MPGLLLVNDSSSIDVVIEAALQRSAYHWHLDSVKNVQPNYNRVINLLQALLYKLELLQGNAQN